MAILKQAYKVDINAAKTQRPHWKRFWTHKLFGYVHFFSFDTSNHISAIYDEPVTLNDYVLMNLLLSARKMGQGHFTSRGI